MCLFFNVGLSSHIHEYTYNLENREKYYNLSNNRFFIHIFTGATNVSRGQSVCDSLERPVGVDEGFVIQENNNSNKGYLIIN